MICPNCGAENDDNAKLCSLCEFEFESESTKSGISQSDITEKEPVKKKKSAVTVIIILLVDFVIILAGFLIYMYFNDDSNKNKSTEMISPKIEATEQTELPTETEDVTETVIETTATVNTAENVTAEPEAAIGENTGLPSEETSAQEKNKYDINELRKMTGKELAELCGDKYSAVVSNYSGTAYEFTSPSVLPGYRVYFEYDGGEKFVPDDKQSVMVFLDYGNATESTWFGMTYSEFIENNEVPDSIYWDNMDGDGFNIVQTVDNISIYYKFQTDSEVFDYLSELTSEYYEFKVDDQINSYLIEQDPCVSEIWCK